MKTGMPNLRPLACAVLTTIVMAAPVLAQGQYRARERARSNRKAWRSLAGALVENGLAVSRESDPLRKAKLFDKVAVGLTEAAKTEADTGKSASAEKLAMCCSRVIDRGIVDNIEKAEQKGEGPGMDTADELLSDIAAHLNGLRQAVEKMPAGRRAEIAKAIAFCENRGHGLQERIRQRTRARQRNRGGNPETGLIRSPADEAPPKQEQGGRGKPPWAGKGGKGNQGDEERAAGTEGAKETPARGKGHGRDQGQGKGSRHRNQEDER